MLQTNGYESKKLADTINIYLEVGSSNLGIVDSSISPFPTHDIDLACHNQHLTQTMPSLRLHVFGIFISQRQFGAVQPQS